MKFAIISDIHGNLPALEAVLEDAEKCGVDSYIFAGDYCISNPGPDGQMQVSYWAYQNRVLYLTHASSDFIGNNEYRNWGTGQVARRYGDSQRPFSVPTWEWAFAAWEKE